ncbi:MAG TPA: Rha family transcriptional regulator [Epulopiscium sp.]|nr:Rha family transcriptional regulator [Candidatus Epulonipiscium sp.]
MNNLTIINQEGKLLVESREVARMVDRPHDQLMRSIRGFAEILEKDISAKMQTSNFFIESTFKDSYGREQPCYLLTRKGCDMVANKMTGEKGIIFTAIYVTKFEEMEKELQAPQIGQFSPELQFMIKVEMEQKQMQTAITQTNGRIDNLKDVISLDTTSWRKDTASLILRMAHALGSNEHIKDLRNESYELLDMRMGVSIATRLTNKRRRMADEGVSKSKRDKLNALDVIADDKKLIEGYVAIVKEMAINYGIA